ncbi:sensor histidine kinase [Thalassotalea sp. PLHSN55]|uniref:sensor histidine kinase n=1 Tax=Thalassotalea sp. PLHSN55 TaxID=3435888 RepID=UPI003F86FA22
MLLGLAATLTVVKQVGLSLAYQDLHKQSSQHLNNLISYIDNTLGRFEKIPEVLSKHPLLQQVLESPQDTTLNQKLNLLLEEMSEVTQASDIYLINASGITVSASNWRKDSSFVGNVYTVRPYFHQALKGGLARYYAVGLTSNQRGYYFAYPVKKADDVIGVIAIKVRIDDIENQHAKDVGSDNYDFLIVAPDNVVFISNRKEWRLNQLDIHTQDDTTSAQTKLGSLPIDNKRYAEREVQGLKILQVDNKYLASASNVQMFQLTEQVNQKQVLAQHAQMHLTNWQVHIWSSLKPIKSKFINLMITGTGGYLLFVIIILFTKERIRNNKQRQQTQLLLEQRVKERTEDLTATNNQLITEIKQREQTQRELTKTQEELIQAAKLAVVGSMSASINHEINQPLTAIKSYSQNALTYQERDMQDKVKGNLHHIIGLTDRLANIVSQFKSFTKKSFGAQSPVSVQSSIKETLAIVKHQAQKECVDINVDIPGQELYILGDALRLEQVFVNILSNGMQAIKGQENKTIAIHVKQQEQHINISFHDSGPGILADNLSKIFEPFFTTKESYGLGIGLSISHRIIESMQGNLSVQNHENGGAVFIINLPLYTPTKPQD